MSRYALLIFDLDDTLFDYAETERSAVTDSCRMLGIVSRDDLYSQYRAANAYVRRAYPEITPENVGRFRAERAAQFLMLIQAPQVAPDKFVEEYLARSAVGVLIPGVQGALEALAGVRKVVATNGTTYPRRAKLESSSIGEHFDGFFSAETLGVAKSSPEYFVRVLEQCGIRRERALIVGDDYRLDILNAVAIGVDSCWFNYRRKPVAALIPRSVKVINQFTDIVGLVGSAQ